MPEPDAKTKVRALVEAVVSQAKANGWSGQDLSGIAFFRPDRDDRITSLEPFEAAAAGIGETSLVAARFGGDATRRLVLQLVYEYFKRVEEPRLDEAMFEAVFQGFAAELEDVNWTTRGVANVRNFTSEVEQIELGDGITIRGRNFDDLSSLGFGAAVLERLSADWSGFGASSFVLVAEHVVRKQPENLILLDTTSTWTKAQRAVGAMRLAAAGDLSIGPMWVSRSARFNVGLGGITQTGWSIPAMGSQYVWTNEVAPAYGSAYTELAQLESEGYGRSPGNLDLALRAFMATYDRWPALPDSRLLDSITGLEALLGSDTEIAFKLAFRVASLLASSDQERGELLKTVKGFYDTRSKVVHGGRLGTKHQLRLANVDQLRVLVRRLLRSFVAFAASDGHGYDKKFFGEQLDAALVDAAQREKLRDALGLSAAEIERESGK